MFDCLDAVKQTMDFILLLAHFHVYIHVHAIVTFNFILGVDFSIRTVDINGKKIRLQMCDTTGEEYYKTIIRTYYRDTKVSWGVVSFVILKLLI